MEFVRRARVQVGRGRQGQRSSHPRNSALNVESVQGPWGRARVLKLSDLHQLAQRVDTSRGLHLKLILQLEDVD